MIVAKCTDEGIIQASDIVVQGGVAVFPTDTVYGIGCDPYNRSAVDRIFRIKHRDEKKPLPVLVSTLSDAEDLVDLGSNGRQMASVYWPGAVTLVAPILSKAVDPRISAGSGKLGVRIPANKCILKLLKRCKRLVGTSANLSGSASPKSAEDVLDSMLEGFDILLDGGRIEKGKESTIVDTTTLKVIREGAVPAEEILRVLGVGKS